MAYLTRLSRAEGRGGGRSTKPDSSVQMTSYTSEHIGALAGATPALWNMFQK